MKREAASAILGLILIHAEGGLGQPEGPGAGTHVSWSEEACLKCHDAAFAADLSGRLTKPCSPMCATCHSFPEKHHPVGVPISKPVSASLVLTRQSTNACVTCHDVTRPRFEKSPWVSQSLFERAFRASSENRTYYLVLRNDRGQICRNCH